MTDTKTKNVAAPDLDAFGVDDDDEAEAGAIRRIEDATGASSGEASALGFETLQMLAGLQDAKVSAASNGHNYDLKFEVDVAGFVRLAVETAKGKGGYSMTWNKLHVGDGAQIKALGSTRDADGEMHYRVGIHLPQSEISRSLGRLGVQLSKKALLVLDPMQGELGLSDGTKVDLTAKAD